MNPTRQCKGFWIPIEIYDHPDLSFMEIFLLSNIYHLEDKEKGGCYATNKYLATLLKVEERTIRKGLQHLRELNLIEDLTPVHLTRILKTKIYQYLAEKEKEVSIKIPKGGEEQNALPPDTFVPPPSSVDNYNSIYKKDNNTLVITPKKEPVASQPAQISFSFQKNQFTGISDEQISKWRKTFPKIDIIKEIQKATQWIISKPARNKKRRKWKELLENEWFPRANEAINVGNGTQENLDLKKIIPIYERYVAWYKNITDVYLLDKGFLVLEEHCFYNKLNSKYKYNINYEKFLDLLENKFEVPSYVIEGEKCHQKFHEISKKDCTNKLK